MKVAFLIERLDPRRGGMETSVGEFLTAAIALGVNVHVVTQEAAADFSIAPAHCLGRSGWERSSRYWHFVKSADAWLKRDHWEVVHAVTPCMRCDLYQPRGGAAEESTTRAVAARDGRIAKALRRLGARLDPKLRLIARLERSLLTDERKPMVAALSSYMHRQLQSAYTIPENQIRDVLNGVTVDLPEPAARAETRKRLRRELGLSESDLVAIFVGHNFRRKGLLRLIEALAEPEARGWKLLVAGKDAPRFYQRYASKMGVSERIRFLGARKDVRQLYLAADFCTLPTYHDPCSRTILEALSLGVPCLTTRYDGSADAIREGEHGFVIDAPDSIRQMAHAFQQTSDHLLREAMARNALALRPRLSMRRHAEEILAVYEEICRRKRGGMIR